METIDLEPQFSTSEIAGKCLRCIAQQQLNDCIMDMLGSDTEDDKLQQKYHALVAFLQSPRAQGLIDETERLLSEGKKVKVKLNFEQNNLTYELKVE